MDIWCLVQIELNGTTLFIAGILGGWRSGSKIEQRRATNCVDMPDRVCSIWAQQSSRCAIFFAIMT
jgi:hypothetical protein